MKHCFKRWLAGAFVAAMATGAMAQVTPAQGITPPDDTPSFKVGSTIFADYTTGDRINDAFNVSRAYINVTGNLNHFISFRVTPDVTRESGSGSSLNGSLTYRLKYAYGQLNLDDWTTHGSWVRFGIQQLPYLDYTEGIYRYRFQGTLFPEREGYITSADAGLSAHWNIPNATATSTAASSTARATAAPRLMTRRDSRSAAPCGRCRSAAFGRGCA